jgi:hypothetical protein
MIAHVSPAEADKRVGGKWFRGYTNRVELVDEARTVDTMIPTEAEFVIFDHGLTVRGTLDLGSSVHSILVVRGKLRARRVILGDAVLVVTDGVEASEFVFGGSNEGLFEVGGVQVERDPGRFAAAIETPILAVMDRKRREMLLREHGEARAVADVVEDALVMDEVDPGKLRKLLLAGRPVFRSAAPADRGDDTAVIQKLPKPKRKPKR